ncbi:hypothetical protein DYB26_005286, partial [Aphanomyces astaci]
MKRWAFLKIALTSPFVTLGWFKMPSRATIDMSARTYPEEGRALSSTAARRTFLRPLSPSRPQVETFAQRAGQVKWSTRRALISSSNNLSSTPFTDARRLATKVAYYSTMRIHIKRVQYALEEEKRTLFYKELAVYLVFLFIMLVTLCELHVQVPFEHNDGLDQLFWSQEFPNQSYKKTVDDVACPDDIWQWFQGVLHPGYYNTTQRNSFRVSSVQIRFSRVQGQLCRTVASTLVSLFPAQSCYPAFEHGVQDTAPYGDDGYGGSFVYETGLRTLDRSLLYTPNLWNFRMDYGTGGYTVYLPRDNADVGAAMLAALAQNLVLPSTRYVSATWVLYNPSTDVVSQLHVLFEISATDRIQTSYRVSSFELREIHSIQAVALDTQSLLMVFLGLVTVGFSYREVQSIADGGVLSYAKSAWNYFEVIQLVCFGRDCFVELTSMADRVDTINNLGATLALVSAAIVFKYLRLNTRLNMLWETLRLAARDLIAFVFIFMFVFFGYAIMGFLLFGTHSQDYRSLSDSLTACFQMLLGAFDYSSLAAANPVMSGVFFFSFMILVFLIVVNMFVAILSEYYTLAQAAKRESDDKKKRLLHATAATDEEEYVEYDIVKQLESFVQDLRWRVKFSRKDPVPLVGNSCVLVVDYAYLMAERARLRTKFRLAFLVVRTCIRWFPRPFDRGDGTTRLSSVGGTHRGLPPKAHPTRHLNYTKFPVTYVPLYSKSAVPLTMIEQLEPGMVLDLDDGSLTFDRICLEVLGPQHLYLAHDANDDPADDKPPPPARTHFGLHHVHSALGSGSHIKCCRVKYQGEIILTGHETCVVSRRVWVKYLLARLAAVVGAVLTMPWWRRRFQSSSNGKFMPKRKRLILDDDLAMLLRAQTVQDDSASSSCRFDELVRQFRLFLAKQARQGAVRIPSHDLETCVTHEAIAFVERFPTALLPLDKRELVGYKYVPAPADTSAFRLPNSIARLSEFLAQNAHEVWSESRIAQGWKWGPHRDNDKKLHPDLLSYGQLTDNAKQYDRESSIETLKVIQALGYAIHPKGASLHPPPASTTLAPSDDGGITQVWDVEFGVAAPQGETYVPKPITTTDIDLSSELTSLVELLAENSHDVWAKKRMHEGWVYGPRRNDATKEHDGLVPYVYLTSEEKDMDRNSAVQTVKCILRCGFTFQHKRTNARAKFRLNWLDPVQRHLTWFQLADSYATEFTTLADLAAMNSVLGGHEGDDVIGVGVYATEKDLVRALRHLNTTRQIRPGYAYSNLNFEILGQVVEGVTGQPWHEYLKTTIWEPLGMHDTVGRALDSRDPNALSGGHFFCNGTVLGPYSLLNSTMVMIRPGDHYIAAGSILSSPSDLAKFSAFLLRKGAGVFRSSAAISDLITGHNVVPMPPEVATFSGYEFHPDGNAVTAGYGFDTVGDMMYGQHYMDKGGDTLAFHTRNGWLPSLGLGVILVANAQSFSGRLSDMATLDLMRTYIVGVFLDISTETLDRQFHESLAEVDALFPPSPCDAHYYGGIPWDIPGVDIPHATKEALVGAYRAVNSPEYYGPLVVTLHGADLWMQYGVYKRRLVATRDPTMLTIWAKPSKSVFPVLYDDLSKRCDDLEIEYAILQRHLESKDLRILELETALAESDANLQTQANASADRIEQLLSLVNALSRDKSRLSSDLAKAAEMEPQLTQTQHYIDVMHDAMMDMEFEMMRLREESARLLTASTAKSQSNAIRRELRGLKKQRCVSQSKWLSDKDDGVEDNDGDDDGDDMDQHEDGQLEDGASSGGDWTSRSSGAAFPILEIDFLDLAQQVVVYAADKTAAQVELCVAMETQLQEDTWQAAVAAMYAISGYTLYLLHREYKDFVARRHHFLSQPYVQQYSVVIHDLPKQLRTCESLTTYLNHLFPNAIHSVVVAVDCKQLEKLVAKRSHYRCKLERALTQWTQSGRNNHRPVHLVKSRGTTVDAIDYFGTKLDRLNYRIQVEIDELETRQKHLYEAMADDCLEDASCIEGETKSLLALMRPTAFVTFRTLLGTHMAQQLLQTSKPTKMLIEAAPCACDINWENLGLKVHVRNTLQLVARYLTIGIVLFWTVPSTVVTSFSSVESLRKLIPALGPTFVTYPWLEGLFKQLTPLGLVIMTALAPVMFTLISHREGHLSEPQVQTSLLHKLVYFQFTQIFAVSVVVGSVLDSLGALVDNPVSAITMLAKAIPAQAASFMSYLIVKTSLG